MTPFILPAIAAVLLLVVCFVSYLAARWFGSGRRRKREQIAIRGLNIPPTVKSPASFPDIAIIDAAQKAAHQSAFDYLGSYRAIALVACLVPPLGVLLLALSLIVEHGSVEWATGLVAGEIVVLIGLLLLVARIHRPTGSWVDTRVRSELLRREQYLCMAVTGPYADLPIEERTRVAGERVAMLQKADSAALGKLEAIDVTGFAYRKATALAAAQPAASSIMPDLTERIASYAWYRIGKQLAWFSVSHEINERWERISTRVLKLALVVAILTAGTHLTMVYTRMAEHAVETSERVELGLMLLAIVLPVICMAVLAGRELFGFRLLSSTYKRTRSELEALKAELEGLTSRVMSKPAPDDERLFQSIVLRAEAELTHEIRVWSIVMSRDELEASA